MILHHVLRVPVRPTRVGMPDLRFVAAVHVRRPRTSLPRYTSAYVKKLGW